MLASSLFIVGCVAGSLTAGRPARGPGGDASALTAEGRLADGAPWDAPGAVVLPPGSEVTLDLGAPQQIRALAVQADNDDRYLVEGSVDERAWSALWTAPAARGVGLRTRRHVLGEPATARYLRVKGEGGDAHYSLGWIGAFCDVPAGFASERSRRSPIAWWRELDDDSIVAVKGGLAALGALLLLAGALLRARGRDAVLRRVRDGLLAVLGVAGFAAWFNLGRFHFDDHVHPWDIYHYYIGAKYFPELGYTRIYECTTVAEAEIFGPAAVVDRTITNLTSNLIEPAAPAVADPGRCTARFTPERWRAFSDDIRTFRGLFSSTRWTDVLHDHGYNATPVWALLGRALASLGPATPAQIELLSLLDPALLAVMWGFVVWAFGWRAACVALLYWGTNYPARYFWNGGAFLRMDWLASAVIGICLCKRGRPGLGGFALGYSALLRVFPVFILVGLLAKMVAGWVRERRVRVAPEVRRTLLGVAVAGLALVPLSLALAPRGAVAEFIDNSRKHVETPLTNNMGWKTVVAYDPRTPVRALLQPSQPDPWGGWKEARRRAFAAREPLYLAGVVAFLALLGWAAAGQPDWVALALGVGLIPFAAELTCYYYGILLVYAFLWPRRPLVGVGLLAVAAASCAIARLLRFDDARYHDISLWVLGFVIVATALAIQREA